MNIHSVGPYFPQIKEWLKFLPHIKHKYTGQGLPNISLKVLLLLIKQCRIREYLTGEEKAQLLEKYNWSCAVCGCKNTELEWDHVEGLEQLTKGMIQRFAPLCTACHAEKTANAPRTLALNYLASHFEKSVYDKYVGSERPPSTCLQAERVCCGVAAL